jgi:hypothetical protein
MIQDLEVQHQDRLRKLRWFDGILGDIRTYQEQLQNMRVEKSPTISELDL